MSRSICSICGAIYTDDQESRCPFCLERFKKDKQTGHIPPGISVANFDFPAWIAVQQVLRDAKAYKWPKEVTQGEVRRQMELREQEQNMRKRGASAADIPQWELRGQELNDFSKDIY